MVILAMVKVKITRLTQMGGESGTRRGSTASTNMEGTFSHPSPGEMSPVPFDPVKQRQIMGRFATGVTVVTIPVGDSSWGMTANAVTSLSLNPPLVLVAVAKPGQTHEHLTKAGCFAINILGEDQEALSNRFASRGPKDLGDLGCAVATTGAPIIPGTLGWVDCRLCETLPGGDHDIFIGEITSGELGEGRPLLFFDGKYCRLDDQAVAERSATRP